MKKRPDHVGNWSRHYDGREAMESAQRLALEDAAAAEVDGYPTPETAAEWLSAMDYRYDATGGGAWLEEAAPKDLGQAVRVCRNALIAAAYMARAMVHDTPYGRHMPLNTVGYMWHHELLKLAYESPAVYRLDSKVDDANRKAWLTESLQALERVRAQWSNSDWPWQARRVFEASCPATRKGA